MDRQVIIAALSGDVEPADLAALDEWRRARPANESQYRFYSWMWSLVGLLGDARDEDAERGQPNP